MWISIQLRACDHITCMHAWLPPCVTCASFFSLLPFVVWDELNDKVWGCLLYFFDLTSGKMTLEIFKREQRCCPPSDSCRLLGACAGWLIAPLKRRPCQSSTFIRLRYLVIVIPLCEETVGRWAHEGADIGEGSRLTGLHLKKKKEVITVVKLDVQETWRCVCCCSRRGESSTT